MFLRIRELIIYIKFWHCQKSKMAVGVGAESNVRGQVKGKNRIVQQKNVGTSVQLFFRLILTRKYIPYIIFMIQGNLQCQKVNLNQIKLRTCVTPHFHGIWTGRSFYGIIFVIQGDP